MSDDDGETERVETSLSWVDHRRSRHTTKFDRVSNSDLPRLFGKRPHMAKAGREIANAAAEHIQRTRPGIVDDPDDPTLADVLRFMESEEAGEQIQHEQAVTLCDLLTRGLTFQEAATWYLYEHAGLTLREIYHVDEGKQRSFSKDRDRQAERNVAATLRTAAEKLDVDLDLNDDE
jgi:hypothetical protein